MMIGVNPRVSSDTHHHHQSIRHPRPRGTRKKFNSHHISFLAGMMCMLAIIALIQSFQITTTSQTATHCDQTNNGATPSVQQRQSTGTSSAAAVKILLLEVHLEGNLGDEMETTPLLEFLQQLKVRQDNPLDISVTAALSGWLEDAEQRLSYRSVREHDKLDHILSWEDFQAWNTNSSMEATTQQQPSYDIVILAPGPWKLCQLRRNVWNNRRLDILFGGSIIEEPKTVDGPLCTIQSRMKRWTPQLVAVRETRSYHRLKPFFDSQKHGALILSGDFTHSFRLAPATFDYWKRHYQDFKSTNDNKLHVIFPRVNNAQHSITFKSRTIVLETWDDKNANLTMTLPAENVIFASSSAIEDERIFQDWMYQHHTLLKEHQFIMCNTVEQLFGLIVNAQHVYTDRYHPGVVAHRLGIDFSIMRYEEERDKLIGLRDLVYKDGYAAKAIRNEYNAKSFAMLGNIIETAAIEKFRTHK